MRILQTSGSHFGSHCFRVSIRLRGSILHKTPLAVIHGDTRAADELYSSPQERVWIGLYGGSNMSPFLIND